MIFRLLLLLATVAAAPNALPAPQTLAAATIYAPKAALHVQVARTPEQRERGLMSVRHLPAHTGMLFVFDQEGPVAFWMKDTLVSLDMVFIAADGTVRKVFSRVPVVSPRLPDARIPLEQGDAKYVIELPAGEAAADGLRAGACVRGLPRA